MLTFLIFVLPPWKLGGFVNLFISNPFRDDMKIDHRILFRSFQYFSVAKQTTNQIWAWLMQISSVPVYCPSFSFPSSHKFPVVATWVNPWTGEHLVVLGSDWMYFNIFKPFF